MATPSSVSPIRSPKRAAAAPGSSVRKSRKTRKVVNAGVMYHRLGWVPAAAATVPAIAIA